jgi:hypothetical protein
MGVAHSSPQNVRAHYGNSVGPFNHKVVIRDHVFICLDAPSLVDEDYQRSASGMGFEKWTPLKDGPVDFVKSVSTGANDCSRVHSYQVLQCGDRGPSCNFTNPHSVGASRYRDMWPNTGEGINSQGCGSWLSEYPWKTDNSISAANSSTGGYL